ncbi:S8 family serine peptidase [Paenibacillus glacialis]|uniref:Peptidase S8/S53 domain-containing protein n=1 Tax=Paenibacillus glacialis TaxID=494026 RepID=A0A168ML95_9BACL|nr:S8 family serine peptidase [Paenibacillus glacialis]OAB44806.1 hypothetical protein PGLA_05180 [Paenibacillus glacialis]
MNQLKSIINVKPVVIAVIDSGISNELLLSNTLVIEKITLTEKGTVWGNAVDEHGHGTAIAGMLSEFCGNSIELIIIKILNENCRSTSIQMIKAIEMAIEMKPDIINMSLGTEDFTYKGDLVRLCNLAQLNDILITTTTSKNNISTLPYILEGTIKVLTHSQLRNDKYLYSDHIDRFYTLGAAHIVPWKNGRIVFINQNSFATPYFIKEFILIKKNEGFKSNYDACNALLTKCKNISNIENNIINKEMPINRLIFNEIIQIVRRNYKDFNESHNSFIQDLDSKFCVELLQVIKNEFAYEIPVSYFNIYDFEYISNLSNKIDAILNGTIN